MNPNYIGPNFNLILNLFSADGVCKDILTIAGPEVEAELKEGEERGHTRCFHATASYLCCLCCLVCSKSKPRTRFCIQVRIVPMYSHFTRVWRKGCRYH